QGLNGAPPIRVVVGEKRHSTIDRSLRILGLGAPTDVVPADANGRMLVEHLELGDEPTILCVQAGEVNTGSFDDFHAIDDKRDEVDWNPEFSRRARGFTVYAAIRSLGRSGIVELVERCCRHARRFAAGLEDIGAEILNDVELNQVLFRFGSDVETGYILNAVQESGEAWMSGTTWDGRQAIRISVSNWQTTDADVERTLAAYAGQLAAR